MPHHDCHGRYALAASGFDDAAVLIMDSIGEGVSTTIAQTKDKQIRTVLQVLDPDSLGYVYGAVTEHLGYRRNDEEGTVMALASFGDPRRFAAVFEQGLRLHAHGFAIDCSLLPDRVTARATGRRTTDAFAARTCPPRRASEALAARHNDLAAALQARTTEVILHLARLARTNTGSRRLVVGGGVAMNCVALGQLLESGVFDAVGVPPAPADSGTAIGAALAVSGPVLPHTDLGPFLGPRFSQEDVARVLRGCSIPWSEPLDPASAVAERLAAGQVVGIFHGPCEVGPRALGHRSILACPRHAETRDRLNRAVKRRESYRPFAPVVLAHRRADWFEGGWESPYMSFAGRVRPEKAAQIPAVVHVDGTARLQTVGADQPFLQRILLHFEALTGIPLLINTSLNIKGKPIPATIEAALECFDSAGLDAICLEGLLVER